MSLTGDYEVVYQRFLERNVSPDRHRGHVVNDCYPEIIPHTDEELLANTISLKQYVEGIRARGFDTFAGGKDRITVDTTDFTRIDLDLLTSKIERWREKYA